VLAGQLPATVMSRDSYLWFDVQHLLCNGCTPLPKRLEAKPPTVIEQLLPALGYCIHVLS
jgi:hypothetical protein